LPKYVVSTTLENVAWTNSHLIRGNIVEEVSALKQQAGQDILIGGSATLVRTLMQLGLIDAYRLLVYPLVLEKGKRLFPEGHRMPLRLVDTQTFRSGVVALTYQPANRGGTA
jgi:dihydrofolate reductase